MKKKVSVIVCVICVVLAAVCGAAVGWGVAKQPPRKGQSFGNPVVEVIRDFSPLIQGFTTFLGAALGGIVAMVTTRLVMAGQDRREREKIRAELAVSRNEVLRTKAEEGLSKIFATIDECNAFAQTIAEHAHALNKGEPQPKYPRTGEHAVIIEAQIALCFYFPQHTALVHELVDAYEAFYKWENDQYTAAIEAPVKWLKSVPSDFIPKLAEMKVALHAKASALMSALQADVYSSLPGADVAQYSIAPLSRGT